MANLINKALSKNDIDKIRTMIAAALGVFLGLRYNDFFKKFFEKFLPPTEGLFGEFVILLILTFIVIKFSGYLSKLLNGGK
jgi:hypothetical protein